MTRLKTSLLLAFMLGAPASLAAQDAPACKGYVVYPGDNLWNIAGQEMNDPFEWKWIIQQNPFLQEPGRKFVTHNGVTVVTIQPGECLNGFNQFGKLLKPKTVSNDNSTQSLSSSKDTQSWSWWWLLLLLIPIGLILYWLRKELDKNPVRSGPSMVPGGVTSASARQRFEERGARESFQILEQVEGYGWGIMNVSYADGRVAPRELKWDRMFRATVRHADGSMEELYMLQGCGNDLRFGGIERVSRYVPGLGFRFVPLPVRTEEPAPVAEPQLAAEPTASSSDEGVVTIDFRRANGQHPTSIKISGAPIDLFTLIDSGDGPTIRYRKAAIKPTE